MSPQNDQLGRAIPVVLYDGVCGLCNRVVGWTLTHERQHDVMFAPLQGETAAMLRQRYTNIPQHLESFVFIDDDVVRVRSRAVLTLARHLRAPWRWAYAWRWLPSPLMDLGYRAIARIRYRVWGKSETCMVPPAESRARFLP